MAVSEGAAREHHRQVIIITTHRHHPLAGHRIITPITITVTNTANQAVVLGLNRF